MLEVAPHAFRALDLPTPYLASEYSVGLDLQQGFKLLKADLAFLEARMPSVRVGEIIDGLGGQGLPLTYESYCACRGENFRQASDARLCRAHALWYIALLDRPHKQAWVRERVDLNFVAPLRGVDLGKEAGRAQLGKLSKVRRAPRGALAIASRAHVTRPPARPTVHTPPRY